jgi:GDP-L-fucose synthase
MNKNSKIYIAGHLGLVGSAILRKLNKEGYTNLITKSRKELDLTDQKAVKDFFEKTKPEYVFLAAAKVGGIMANKTYPGEFISENLDIQNNIIKNSYIHGVKKLLFLGSSCIYPKLATQPIKEEYFMKGPLEPTNEAYAIAKIAGISMCQSYRKQYGADFISLMPTNLYGPGDNFTNERGHVIPALIRKFHDAKAKNLDEISAWGTGSAKREFLHSDDLADACVFLMKNYSSGDIINVGTGEDVTIKELTEKISKIVGFKGKIVWDTTKPDGAPRRLLDVEKLHTLGWKHHIELEKGLEETYEWFKKNVI